MNGAPAGLYLHVPFCSRVCPYCDFAVRTGDADRRRRYADHLIEEIRLHEGASLRFDTIYFGGGTPSSLSPEDLRRVIDEVRRRLRIEPGCRIFLEANPEDAEPGRLRAWRALGVETLSLGVQSLDDDALKFLGRRHDAADARRAIAAAHDAGFSTVSVDMIYGLPDQADDHWRRDLERALACGVHHLSCYQLTIHERTRFGLLARRGALRELPTDRQARLFRLTHRLLNDAGMQGYEVSQFALSVEHRSRHNLKYWDHTPYLGLGPSAHSYHERRRWWNLRRTDDYQAEVRAGKLPIEGEESLDAAALALEALMTGLRTYRGVDLERLRTWLGIDLAPANVALLERLRSAGLAVLADSRVVPTLDGLAVADAVARQFTIP